MMTPPLSESWIRVAWPGNPRVQGLFTSRQGGVSLGAYGCARLTSQDEPRGGMNLGSHVGDAPLDVAANRASLAACLGDLRIAYLDQVHGTDVADLDAWDGASGLQADAAVSSTPGLAACVLVADCLPVLFAAPAGRAVGAAHAGWRGLAGGVLERTVQMVCRKAACTPAEVQAWLGPAIGPQAFEVGGEVYAACVGVQPQAALAFVAAGPGKWHADLFQLARLRLQAAGLPLTQIQGGGICTVTNPARYYAYRRDRVTGRQAGLIWVQRHV